MNKKMYEVNWHQNDEMFVRCSVTPITVTRLGILRGCSSPTIDAIDINGRRFTGNPDEYFETEAEAWDNVRKEVAESIAAQKAEMEIIAKNVQGMEAFLATITGNQGVQIMDKGAKVTAPCAK